MKGKRIDLRNPTEHPHAAHSYTRMVSSCLSGLMAALEGLPEGFEGTELFARTILQRLLAGFEHVPRVHPLARFRVGVDPGMLRQRPEMCPILRHPSQQLCEAKSTRRKPVLG